MRFSLLSFVFCAAVPAAAQNSPDALQWLQKATTAARTLTYSGTFIYQNEGRIEASRIAHAMEGGRELERLEVLEGSPREVVRDNDEVKCYLPESRLVILERRNTHSGFPAVLPEGLAGITDFYVIRRGPPARIAGLATQSIVIDPRDEYRFGRQFWVDADSGLLLKAGLRNESGGFTESFTFTELHMGGAVNRDLLKSHVKLQSGDWQVHDIRSTELHEDDRAWVFQNSLPGFRKVSEMRRPPRADGPERTHFIFSDGFSAISVFIEPVAADAPSAEPGQFSMGAINVYRRSLDRAKIVVMGDVPPLALKVLGDGIARAEK